MSGNGQPSPKLAVVEQQQPPPLLLPVEELLSSSATSRHYDPSTQVLSFAVRLPSDMSFVPTDPDNNKLRQHRPAVVIVANHLPVSQQQAGGIVGTITLMGDKSVLIWFGWGNISTEVVSAATETAASSSLDADADDDSNLHAHDEDQSRRSRDIIVGSATNLFMGSLLAAMPRSKYQGAFSSVDAAPTSKLIGDGNLENERIASQVADRLSQKLQMSVLVSCHLEETPSVPGCDGVMERQLLRSRAGALAEQEIFRILSSTKLPG